VPAIGSLHRPSSRLPSDSYEDWRFTTAADVRNDTALSDFLLSITVVIALVHAQMLGADRLAVAMGDSNGV
jgi:hypothetical protein